MKTTTLLSTALLGALTTFGSVAYAQDASPAPGAPSAGCEGGKCGPRGHGGGLAFLTKKLNLTDAQVAQIKPIKAEEFKQTRAAIEDNSLSKLATKEKVQAIRKDAQEKINAILTPEQQAKLKDMKAKWEAKKGQHEADKDGGPQ